MPLLANSVLSVGFMLTLCVVLTQGQGLMGFGAYNLGVGHISHVKILSKPWKRAWGYPGNPDSLVTENQDMILNT